MKFVRTFVIGGTRGLGAELAKLALAEDQVVVVTGRGQPISNVLARGATCYRMDLNSPVEQAVDGIIGVWKAQPPLAGPIRLIWAAAMMDRFLMGSAGAIGPMDEMLRVNFTHGLHVVNYLWEEFSRIGRRYGQQLVVISSTTALAKEPKPEEAMYAATKAAQSQWARAFGGGLTSPGQSLLLVHPGGMKTDLWRETPVDAETMKTFMDPMKVAMKIHLDANKHDRGFQELTIPRSAEYV